MDPKAEVNGYVAKLAAKVCNQNKEARILDLGCGTGVLGEKVGHHLGLFQITFYLLLVTCYLLFVSNDNDNDTTHGILALGLMVCAMDTNKYLLIIFKIIPNQITNSQPTHDATLMTWLRDYSKKCILAGRKIVEKRISVTVV